MLESIYLVVSSCNKLRFPTSAFKLFTWHLSPFPLHGILAAFLKQMDPRNIAITSSGCSNRFISICFLEPNGVSSLLSDTKNIFGFGSSLIGCISNLNSLEDSPRLLLLHIILVCISIARSIFKAPRHTWSKLSILTHRVILVGSVKATRCITSSLYSIKNGEDTDIS